MIYPHFTVYSRYTFLFMKTIRILSFSANLVHLNINLSLELISSNLLSTKIICRWHIPMMSLLNVYRKFSLYQYKNIRFRVDPWYNSMDIADSLYLALVTIACVPWSKCTATNIWELYIGHFKSMKAIYKVCFITFVPLWFKQLWISLLFLYNLQKSFSFIYHTTFQFSKFCCMNYSFKLSFYILNSKNEQSYH